MPIDTRLNRPNEESEHAAETRDYRTNGGRHPGHSRFAQQAAGGYPYASPHYKKEESGAGAAPETAHEEDIGGPFTS